MQFRRRKSVYLGVGLIAVILVSVAANTPAIRRRLYEITTLRLAHSTVLSAVSDVSSWVSTLRSRSMIQDYVRDHSVRKLQLGAGATRLKDWLNTDISMDNGLVYLDATKPFPMDGNSFHYVFSEHVIEHLTHEEGVGMLKETYRILAPNGKVRIATPNLLRFTELFQGRQSEQMQAYLSGKLASHRWPQQPSAECFVLNLELTQFGHRFLYDPATLEATLAKVGFESIQQVKIGESDDPHLRGVESSAEDNREWIKVYETMVFEASKP
jgi:predicted SAM-dependent methyltransferase